MPSACGAERAPTQNATQRKPEPTREAQPTATTRCNATRRTDGFAFAPVRTRRLRNGLSRVRGQPVVATIHTGNGSGPPFRSSADRCPSHRQPFVPSDRNRNTTEHTHNKRAVIIFNKERNQTKHNTLLLFHLLSLNRLRASVSCIVIFRGGGGCACRSFCFAPRLLLPCVHDVLSVVSSLLRIESDRGWRDLPSFDSSNLSPS